LLILSAAALLLAHISIRRAAPLLMSALIGHATWTATRDLGATAASATSALMLGCWVLDAASRRPKTRPITVAVEMTAAALWAGFIAASIAHALHGNVVWITHAVAIGAAAIVASWRKVAF